MLGMSSIGCVRHAEVLATGARSTAPSCFRHEADSIGVGHLEQVPDPCRLAGRHHASTLQEPTVSSSSPSLSADITVSVAGSQRTVTAGATASDLFGQDKATLVARVNGELRDLAHVLAEGDLVEPVGVDSEEGLAVLRHSAAHVLAQAVQQIHPTAKLGIGPPITDGFYYDFDVEVPFTPEDLKAIDKAMTRIIKEGQTFRRWDLTEDEARTVLADQPYKLELIGLKGTPGSEDDGASVEVGLG